MLSFDEPPQEPRLPEIEDTAGKTCTWELRDPSGSQVTATTRRDRD